MTAVDESATAANPLASVTAAQLLAWQTTLMVEVVFIGGIIVAEPTGIVNVTVVFGTGRPLTSVTFTTKFSPVSENSGITWPFPETI